MLEICASFHQLLATNWIIKAHTLPHYKWPKGNAATFAERVLGSQSKQSWMKTEGERVSLSSGPLPSLRGNLIKFNRINFISHFAGQSQVHDTGLATCFKTMFLPWAHNSKDTEWERQRIREGKKRERTEGDTCLRSTRAQLDKCRVLGSCNIRKD